MKTVKYLSISLLGMLCMLISLILLACKPLPIGNSGQEAEDLADKMLSAINHEAWEKTGAVEWKFRGSTHHIWDKERHYVYVQWSNKEVWLDINAHQGIVKIDGQLVDDPNKKWINHAAKRFNNDSFWLNAISKIKDPGTIRHKITNKGENPSLLVTYTQGGDTPGDSYLWILDENHRPVAWRLWVKIVPIKGLKFSWENWNKYETGVWLSSLHKAGPAKLEIKDIRTAKDLEELAGEDIFSALEALEKQ